MKSAKSTLYVILSSSLNSRTTVLLVSGGIATSGTLCLTMVLAKKASIRLVSPRIVTGSWKAFMNSPGSEQKGCMPMKLHILARRSKSFLSPPSEDDSV